jgi:hypothetical protein
MFTLFIAAAVAVAPSPSLDDKGRFALVTGYCHTQTSMDYKRSYQALVDSQDDYTKGFMNVIHYDAVAKGFEESPSEETCSKMLDKFVKPFASFYISYYEGK